MYGDGYLPGVGLRAHLERGCTERMNLRDGAREEGARLRQQHGWRPSNRATSSGYVYLITDGEHVKIGVAQNVRGRLSTLQGANARELRVVACIKSSDPYRIESELHQRFQDKRLRGEWFRDDPCIREAFAA